MGEWLVWLILGSLILIVFCIYSLSSQVERCVHLAVEIITGNQRKIMAQLDASPYRDRPPTLPPMSYPSNVARHNGAGSSLRASTQSGSDGGLRGGAAPIFSPCRRSDLRLQRASAALLTPNTEILESQTAQRFRVVLIAASRSNFARPPSACSNTSIHRMRGTGKPILCTRYGERLMAGSHAGSGTAGWSITARSRRAA